MDCSKMMLIAISNDQPTDRVSGREMTSAQSAEVIFREYGSCPEAIRIWLNGCP